MSLGDPSPSSVAITHDMDMRIVGAGTPKKGWINPYPQPTKSTYTVNISNRRLGHYSPKGTSHLCLLGRVPRTSSRCLYTPGQMDRRAPAHIHLRPTVSPSSRHKRMTHA
jgi:hypothetical protein